MKVTVIDNYDSFVYNLCDYLSRQGAEVTVYRNDEKTPEFIAGSNPGGVLISPGPGDPSGAGISVELIKILPRDIPLLGVCLGHQALAEAYGGRIIRARNIMHGMTSLIHHDGKGIFRGLKNPFRATRYHSLAVDEAALPEVLEITARADSGEVMGLRHREFEQFGVQFHPESIISEEGLGLIKNFTGIIERRNRVSK